MKNKVNFFKISVVSILVLLIAIILTLVSIFGENNKIDVVAEKYFQTIMEKDYKKSYEIICNKSVDGKLIKSEKSFDFNFILELSLRKKYNLVEWKKYKIDVKRSKFWIPFFTNDTVKISLRLIKEEEQSLFDILFKRVKVEYVKDLIIIVRDNGMWKIKDIDVKNNNISDVYSHIKEKMKRVDLFNYTENGLDIHNFSFDLKKMSPIDKLIFKYYFYKIIDSF